MIKVSNYADKIAEVCFSEENKELLEYQCGKLKVTIADQIRHYFKGEWYEGDEQKLCISICIVIGGKGGLILEQLRSLMAHVKLYTNPVWHDEVYARTEESTRTASAAAINSQDSDAESHSKGAASSDDKSDSWTQSESRNAGGEMDEVNKIGDVWQEQTISHGSKTVVPSTDPNTPPTVNVTKPYIEKGDKESVDIKYRQFSLAKDAGEDVTTSESSESYSRDEATGAKSSSLDLSINKSRGDKSSGGRKSKRGEQFFNILNKDIPSKREEFWELFYGLFRHERNY